MKMIANQSFQRQAAKLIVRQVGCVKLRNKPINAFFLLGVLLPSINSGQASPNL